MQVSAAHTSFNFLMMSLSCDGSFCEGLPTSLVIRRLFGLVVPELCDNTGLEDKTSCEDISFLLCVDFIFCQKQTEPNVRNKILYLIQAWAHAFRNESKYKVVQDTYQIMKVEGK